MTQQAGRELTLFDLSADYQWIRQMGWSDDDLRNVNVHEDADSSTEFINIMSTGGTDLGLGLGTSSGAGSVPNMYVYKNDTPANLYQKLQDLLKNGGPSGYPEGSGSDNASFPPSGSGA